MHYLVYSETFEERLEDIKEIKKENKYLYALKKFLKYIKLKIIVFIIINSIIISFCFYYIVIFCIIYNKTQRSLLINFLTSLLEKLIKSVIVVIVIVVTRKIGINCENIYLFNTSKYIDKYF